MSESADVTPIPVATYRLQLTPTFGFADVVGLLDHIAALGVSDLYLSPISEANPGSLHGYDVVDHRVVRADFGGPSGLTDLLDAAGAAGLGVIIDHVPNHVSVQRAELNEPWWTMLRDGRTSPSAAWFDVDWSDRGAVVVPVLGEPIAGVLDNGDLTVEHRSSGSVVRYADLQFPVAPGTEDLDLADLLAAQNYDLVWWRNPARNVRRFFTIDDLVGVRVEDPAVAAIVDTIPVQLCEHRAFRGVRVDHVDGLADPTGYLLQLRSKLGDRMIWVEKIVSTGESMPRHWPVAGTTGYESIAAVERCLVDPQAAEHLVKTWNEATASSRTYDDLEHEACSFVLNHGLRPDLERLHRRIRERIDAQVIETNGETDGEADGEASLAALEAITLGLGRYRTYLPDDERSLDVFAAAVARADSQRPGLATEIGQVAEALRDDPVAMRRWQQLTGPVRAKGAEDRAFYRYLPLASLCEVGGDPGTPSVDVDAFHRHQSFVQDNWPQTLIAGTTHDTKRSEDLRARSLALADAPAQWRTTLAEVTAECDRQGITVGPSVVSLAAQTVATAWPLDANRLTAYLVKAEREAGATTTWSDPDEQYEASLAALAEMLCAGVSLRTELAGLSALVAALQRPGVAYSLTTLAMRLTLPGIPDLYQGTEALTFTLVDPDNRRDPDWNRIRRMVDAAPSGDCVDLWNNGDFDALKACTMVRLLHLRRRLAAVFGPGGSYRPVTASGPRSDGIIAYVRGDGDGPRAMVIARRGPADETPGSASHADRIELPAGTWRNVLDPSRTIVGGNEVNVSWWLDRFPVAVLEIVES